MDLLSNTVDRNKNSVALKTIGTGKSFHFSHVSWPDAMNEKLFYMVCGTEKDNRMTIVNVFDGELLVRDSSQRVIKTEINMIINPDVLT